MIEAYVKPQGQPDWFKLDGLEDTKITLNVSVNDVREPENLQGTFSKAITFKGTDNNNKIFTHLYEINVQGGFYTFNINKKSDFEITVDGITFQTYNLQLIEIVLLENREIDYVCQATSNVLSFFNIIKDRYLEDLDLSAFSHVLNTTNVIASIDGDRDYRYALVDYGYPDLNNWKSNTIRPLIPIRAYFDKIIEEAGYTYSSNFVSNTFTTGSNYEGSIFLLPNIERLRVSNTFIKDNSFKAVMDDPQVISVTGSAPTQIDLVFDDDTNLGYDQANIYESTNGDITVTNTRTYLLSLFLNLIWKPTGGTFVNGSVRQQAVVSVKLLDSSFNVVTQTACIFVAEPNVTIPVGIPLIPLTYPSIVNDVILDTSLNSYKFVVEYNGIDFINAGDLEVLSGSFVVLTATSNAVLGDTIDYTTLVPKDVKQSDFITSLCKMFNLFIDVDKATPNNLIIETRDYYYQNIGTTKDLTNYVDRSVAFKIKSLAEIGKKGYLYTYSKSEDLLNKNYSSLFYNTNHEEIYGEYYEEVDNDFVEDVQKVETIFKNTIIRNDGTNTLNDRVIPTIFSESQNGDSTYELRIGFISSLDCNPYQIEFTNANGSVTTLTLLKYNYFGHFKRIVNPQADLNFGTNLQYYYNAPEITENNLFNIYWKNDFEQRNSVGSRIITIKVWLPINIFYNLSLADTILVDNQAYFINKIVDYDLLDSNMCTMELILKSPILSYEVSGTTRGTPDIIDITDNTDNTGGGFGSPRAQGERNHIDQTLNATILGDNNLLIQGSDVTIVGSENVVRQSYLVSINGTANIVENNTSGVTIIGNDNTVKFSSENVRLIGTNSSEVGQLSSNVVMINCDSLTLASGTSDVTYIDNCLINACNTENVVTVDSDYVMQPNDKTVVVDNPVNPVTQITLPDSATSNLSVVEITVTDTTNAVQFIAFGTDTLFGDTSNMVGTAYEIRTFTKINGGWIGK
jgi:hypothetical protein